MHRAYAGQANFRWTNAHDVGDSSRGQCAHTGLVQSPALGCLANIPA